MKDIEALLHEYRKLHKPYADAKAKRCYLEEYKKIMLALLMKAAESSGVNSVAAQEREALVQPQVKQHVIDTQQAVADEEFKRLEIKAYEVEIEVWRTQSANERMEKKAYGL
jgi:hypothetical protein